MPAPRRAILADISVQKLDPKEGHSQVGKNGLFKSKKSKQTNIVVEEKVIKEDKIQQVETTNVESLETEIKEKEAEDTKAIKKIFNKSSKKTKNS